MRNTSDLGISRACVPYFVFMNALATGEVAQAMTARARETWGDYVRRVTDQTPRKRVAEAAGVDQSGLSRWVNGSAPSAAKVISFARGLNRSPIEALIAAGYLEPADLDGPIEVAQSPAALTDDALVDELRSRLKSRKRSVGGSRSAATDKSLRGRFPDRRKQGDDGSGAAGSRA